MPLLRMSHLGYDGDLVCSWVGMIGAEDDAYGLAGQCSVL